MAASPAYELNRLYAMMGDTTKALGYMAMLIALVAAISIFISLYNSLKERRYEIAIIRVHGATPLQVFLMILFEGLIISMLGLIVGMVAGHIGMELAGALLQDDYKYSFSGWLWVHGEYWIIMAALGVGILASLLPAIQGSGINLHKTLAEG
jgi:putative ABC transport system permease protein